MKAIHALLLLMFIYMANADVEGFAEKTCEAYMPGKEPAFSLDFCRSTKIVGDAVRCCFVKLESNDNEKRLYHCYPIKKEHWADIDILIDSLEQEYKEVVSIECGASYLYASLLILIALLF